MRRIKRSMLVGRLVFGAFLGVMALVCLLGLGKSVEHLLGENESGNGADSWISSSQGADGNPVEKKDATVNTAQSSGNSDGTAEDAFSNEAVAAFATKYSLSASAWPKELLELLDRNPDAEEFVLNYPLKKDRSFDIDLTEYENSATVPLFLQWDERWGYTQYGSNVMGLTGCGPTCLSMVCVYLLKDAAYSPRYLADFAEENGYYVDGSGSTWTLISKGGETLGLDVVEISVEEHRMMKNLELGNPIICIMGPGDFTTTGHFIVLTGCKDGKFVVNDPNSRTNSERLWSFEEIKGQIKNLWVCRLPE